MPRHALVVGGTGMLSGLVEALAGDGGRLSLLSRHASQHPGGIDCDYHDAAAFSRALEVAVERNGPIDLAIAWFHTLRIAAPRLLAEQVRGRMFQVLGSATADPAHPQRLATAAAVAEGLQGCQLRQVVLGFQVTGDGSRWLTNEEISGGVLDAVRTDRPLTIIGQVEPWAARP
ncbi:hypothetical protein ASE17_00930 [Phenylobacterium sp. Root77]|uniref:hypothetical protein n=1 Tax=unclassified Phenylobacterium TaxID=2640670 RepID=UPI0006FDF053|nr:MULTISPECIES: hypothetical protein [unclassified Phenylobacterium]KQW71494.1 hypothetical protein ASC73_05155 [Phenylobacterium sp. Root1277]KQW94414.1 hypothetical protein ASC79_01300 [Phenylobacterium sp. Root1290]KRC44108.1 hypothetical protein ASE17_00930 [Phenylobacterium sp. Root77]